MIRLKCSIAYILIVISKLSFAESDFKFSPYVETFVPVHFSVGGKLEFSKLSLGAGLGFMPAVYSSMIGAAAADLGKEESYKEVIEASFEKNMMFKTHASYHFSGSSIGWFIGGSFSYFKTSGVADIESLLVAATGRDFSGLIALLNAAGRSTDVDLDGNIILIDILGGHSWSFYENLNFSTSLGISKVVSSEIDISTGLTNFEASSSGGRLIAATEDDLEKIVRDYGLIPTIGLNLAYDF